MSLWAIENRVKILVMLLTLKSKVWIFTYYLWGDFLQYNPKRIVKGILLVSEFELV